MSSCKCGARWTGLKAEHCVACHETFSGTTAGDKHRTGDHAVSTGPARRRCLTADEMLAKGMAFITNSHGTWVWTTGRSSQEWLKSLAPDGPGLRTDTPEGGGPETGLEAVTEMEAS